MLLKKTIVKESHVAGLGLFADEDINNGEIVWTFHPSIDKEVDLSEWIDLPIHCWNYMISHSWICNFTGKRFMSFDNDRFTNHSDDPNISEDDTGNMLANRHIKKGEEILCDYEEIHDGDPWEGKERSFK